MEKDTSIRKKRKKYIPPTIKHTEEIKKFALACENFAHSPDNLNCFCTPTSGITC